MKAAPSFFKFFLTGNSIDMKIPKAFICRMKQVLPKKVLLRDRYNNVWTVKVAKVGDCWYFVDGWDKFVEDCLLTSGDFMVFKYFGDSVFNVKVYGPSATEKTVVGPSMLHVDDHEEETESKSCDYVSRDDDDDDDNAGSDDSLCIPMKPQENECQEVVHGRDDDDDDSDDEYDDYDDGDDSDYIPLKPRQSKRRKVVHGRDDNHDDDHGFDDDDSDDKDCIPLKSRQNKGRKVVQRREEDDDSDDSDYIQMKPREVMRRQVNNVGAGVSRNKRDQTTNLYPKWYGMEIFEAGLAKRPKNPYFVTKIMPKRRSSLFIPIDVIKDYKLDLERRIILVDPEGRKFHTTCKKWKNGRWILSGGWRRLCTMNFVALEDTCICEFVQTEGHNNLFLRISFVRSKTRVEEEVQTQEF